MPYIHEKKGTLILKKIHKDRRIKLNEEDKENIIKLHKQGISIREITRRYNVSRRLIQFIIFPERYVRNVENYHARGGWQAYYDKDRRRTTMKEHRHYKQSVFTKLQKEGV